MEIVQIMATNLSPGSLNLAHLAAGKATALEREMLVRTNNVAMNQMYGYQAIRIGEKSQEFHQRTGEITNFAVETSSYIDQAQGPLIATGDYLDFAIGGHGLYAQVQKNGQTYYVRSAKGGTDELGHYIAIGSNAMFVDNGGSPFQVQPGMTIGEDGVVADVHGNILGALNIVKIDNPTHVADGLYTGGAQEADDYKVMQGYLEDSNVNTPIELALFGKASEEYRHTINLMSMFFKQQQQTAQSLITPSMA
ncbi:Flagellar basal body rod protein FlgF [Candidatus Bealeia paramacronuclearis]|uniref:Flagellar basal body rod protein FlgF n=1 Tax=Candidatus Bealeia paramacronuclearis TaxID=1921001 RepID=A0ABZ2C5Z0_9PROT|nr:Flagellar basal body rod protein FlgF [Candidatus Bealeia paramacronuclearis]